MPNRSIPSGPIHLPSAQWPPRSGRREWAFQVESLRGATSVFRRYEFGTAFRHAQYIYWNVPFFAMNFQLKSIFEKSLHHRPVHHRLRGSVLRFCDYFVIFRVGPFRKTINQGQGRWVKAAPIRKQNIRLLDKVSQLSAFRYSSW